MAKVLNTKVKEMDIRAKIVLDMVKSIPGAENAVIAGGAVRDLSFGVPNKDVDIFIPNKSLTEIKKEIGKLDKNIVDKGDDYRKSRSTSLSKPSYAHKRYDPCIVTGKQIGRAHV